MAHDNILSRLTGQHVQISNTKFYELPLIQKKVPVDFDPGQFYFKDREEENERQFVTLESVLKEFPSVQENDFKDQFDKRGWVFYGRLVGPWRSPSENYMILMKI